MKPKVKSLIKLSGIIIIFIFIILYNLKKPQSGWDYWDLTLESAGYSVTVIAIYERYLWKYNPFVKIPRLKKKYIGVLNYNYKGESGEKTVEIEIMQSFLYTDVKFKSDEINSKTITSDLVEENGGFVLYYTYITNPLSRYSEKNPIQIGTCKLQIDKNDTIKGSYWTNRKTIGDLILKSKE